jgi:uncharacterized membrane protein YfcA
MQVVLSILVGLLGGGLGGLVGLGGGFIMVPLLVYLFHMGQHDAQGTSLAVLLPPVGILSVMQYWRAEHVNLPVALWAALGFLIGGWAGGAVAQLIAGPALRRVFAVVLIVAALDLLRRS